MTNEEKFKAIVERSKTQGVMLEESMISIMVIICYMNELEQAGIMESGISVTRSGKDIYAICQEFDWKPSNEDIINFVTGMPGMVEKHEQAALVFILKKYRDDPNGLLDEFKKSGADPSP
jgi:hypothetical protein